MQINSDELPTTSPLPSATSGIRFERLTLDVEIGPEFVLILTDSTPFAHELQRHVPFGLHLKSGAAQTSFGPLLFLLWWMPPITNRRPFALYEQVLNPAHAGTLQALREILEQTHLHLILIGPQDELLDVYEFDNVFGLGELISISELGYLVDSSNPYRLWFRGANKMTKNGGLLALIAVAVTGLLLFGQLYSCFTNSATISSGHDNQCAVNKPTLGRRKSHAQNGARPANPDLTGGFSEPSSALESSSGDGGA